MATSDNTTLPKLISDRSSIKTQLTKFKNYCDQKGATTLLESLEARLHRNESLLDKFEVVQDQIDRIVAGTSEENVQHVQRENFEEIYFNVIGSVRAYIARSRNPTQPHATPSTLRTATVTPSTSESSTIKLRPIPVPNFSGDLGERVYFRDSFESLVNNNEALTARAIASLAVSEENYTVAWETLKERFEDVGELIEFHIRALFECSSMTKDSARDLRQLLDDFYNHLRSLKSLKEPVDHWDSLLIYLLSKKLDTRTTEAWNKKASELGEKKGMKDLQAFLEQHYKFLSKSVRSGSAHSTASLGKETVPKSRARPFALVTTGPFECPSCKGSHALAQCKEYFSLALIDRVNKVKELRVCFNCLKPGHGVQFCKSGPCRKCQARHHTSLHVWKGSNADSSKQLVSSQASGSETKRTNITGKAEQENQQRSPSPQSYTVSNSDDSEQVLLSTAIIHVVDTQGNRHKCRALLDQASTVNIVKGCFARRLGLNCLKSTSGITGVGGNDATGQVIGNTNLTIESRVSGYSINLKCILMDKITPTIPTFELPHSTRLPSHMILADPTYAEPRDVDLLIGNAHFWEIMSVGLHKLGKGLPVLVKTQFGWIFGGRINNNSIPKPTPMCNLITNEQLHHNLNRFWEIEHFSVERVTPDPHPCEQHFVKTVTRNSDGRYIVSIPFNERLKDLGESYDIAKRRFLHLESKLQKSLSLRQEYISFMREYEHLGHMTKITSNSQLKSNASYYLPHHAVTKVTSTTTKLRVVFDGSAKTTSGVSCNDAQDVGPVIQDDLFTILIRFRQHRIVLTADIEKMYRQVLVAPRDRAYQRILWRETPTGQLAVYELNTITYGTASAPFLATRVLKEVSLRCPHARISGIIARDFYVDDLITGGDTVKEAQFIKNSLEKTLFLSGFKLRKWASNAAAALCNNEGSERLVELQNEKDPKTLGLLWSPSGDELRISAAEPRCSRLTKRIILSEIAKIFDPLGLIGPVVIRAKILMQGLWQLDLKWDESVPLTIHSQFSEFQSDIQLLNNLTIPRCTLGAQSTQVEIHGFCDASEKAYGACVYLRSVDKEGQLSVHLLCAKSRVAPIKVVSLPRLELCGSLLLIQLISKVREASRIQISNEFYWSDSMITLAWIEGSPSKWKTFVANRVTEIQGLSRGKWCHVPSNENPADLLSRGVKSSALEHNNLWWNGPNWLQGQSIKIAKPDHATIDLPEQRVICAAIVDTKSCDLSWMLKFSKYLKLLKVIAYCFKIYNNCKHRVKKAQLVDKDFVPSGVLSIREIDLAEIAVLKIVQKQAFASEISEIKRGKGTSDCYSLQSLHPFIDDQGLVRVGGRLSNASIEYEQQHPVILPKDNHITKLIVRKEHERLLHAGCETVLSTIRQKYWPISGKSLVRKIIRDCVRCRRLNPQVGKYLMGQLPATRVRIQAPFFTTGVDYAGPFYVKDRTRSKTVTKAYLSLFVCFVTKAVHLELVTELSTHAFLNALDRFVARRGLCRTLYSDNGTNFVGARNEMQKIIDFFRDGATKQDILYYAITHGIDWHFIPPRAPHFGGLWESAVRSAKRQLLKVVGDTRFTFEELATVLTRIEACMNSRPLYPMSSDSQDLSSLTPGHFLIGGPLTAVPQLNVTDISVNRLSRFQLLQAMYQHFWKRWQRDYLHNLQQRSKWKLDVPEQFRIGTMVIVKEDNLPPLRWKLGRIVELHPGADRVTKVVSVRTSDGVFTRPVSKICILPVHDEGSCHSHQSEEISTASLDNKTTL